jgi:hypothetical protein
MADFQDFVVCGLVPPEKIRQDRHWRHVYRHEQWARAVCLVRRDEILDEIGADSELREYVKDDILFRQAV